MLNLHLMQQNIPILGKLNLTGTPHEHFERPAWSEVGFEDGLEAGGCGDVYAEGCVFGDYFGGGGELLES